MRICGTIVEVNRLLKKYRKRGEVIGFVPTMGALHEGHLSLLAESKKQCTISVCSIFVNPTQFNDKKDLERYPRTPEKDCKMLEEHGCDLVFMPSAEEMYPELDKRIFDFGKLDKVLDGAHRPGHFNGVGQIVSKLFDIIKPDKAFFGLKDYQQVLIVKNLVKQLKQNVEVVPCPILREHDGLAMSSRNMLLSIEERKAASLIPRVMQMAKENYLKMPLAGLKNKLLEEIKKEPLLKPDYMEFCNADTLEGISENSKEKIIFLVAIFSGKIRLIDNIPIN
ncbi:MAG TPA: pantoate--beta-alanine ligase [Bacteroidia bacterium]|jgi:pantoate--beta-alanine ligase|nr:pantoate--beta-alanine ligase [Bacteroidia bacterium]